jgi:transposase-like protein
MSAKQTWTCEHCKKTFNDPNGSFEYFHSCRESKRYFKQLWMEQQG